MQTCKECNGRFYDLRAHLKKHKMTWKEYEDKHHVKLASFLINAPISEYEKLAKQVDSEFYVRIERRRNKAKIQNFRM